MGWLWTYILPGTTEKVTVRARTTKQDDENMIIVLAAEEGSDVRAHFKHFTATVKVSPKGDGSLVTWIVEFEKHHHEVPDPHLYLALFNKLTEKVDGHVHKDGISKGEIETEVKCNPHKFYECIKYSLHHLPAIFPEGYTDCKILEGDGKSEGTLRQWKYKLLGSTEEMTVRARTTKQDDKNMIITLCVEEGSSVKEHYKHFTVIIQVNPKGNGSAVKWTVEFEKHSDEIPDPHAYLELFDKLNEKVDEHLHKKK
ncbi:Mlp-like protein [Thalictrum thalictroides]|uniref:Mlp-like protein n=1 Tax=Thalictrum thalictroides TaxID=46969 RepID=A0A7J6WVN6_THATH|nr:Mlp-like protein [Thalictrum thalictroides]